jgi:cytochrome c oxidase subunit 2
MLRNVFILVLTVGATAAGAWARQVKAGADEVQTIDVIASQFKFEPATISVVEGDRVRLRLRSADRTHGIGIKAFRVKALIPKMGEAVTVEFVADRSGTFDITCSEYCGTGHAAMKGSLIVLASEK